MAKVISQATFDQVVKDNVDEFEMSLEDAIGDAVDQFAAQGVELSNIVKDVKLSDDGSLRHAVADSVLRLREATEAELKAPDAAASHAAVAEVAAALAAFHEECAKDLAHRLLAAAGGAYPCLVNLCEHRRSGRDLGSGEKSGEDTSGGTAATAAGSLAEAVLALGSLLNGQPDLLDDAGAELLLGLLAQRQQRHDAVTDGPPSSQVVAGSCDSGTGGSAAAAAVAAAAARAMRFACVLHEGNRQRFVERQLIPTAAAALVRHRDRGAAVKDICAMLRALTLDDDVRVAFGKGHDHAKELVTEAGALELILDIAKGYASDPVVLGELLSTVGQLAVRNEFCQRVMDLGGLQLMLSALRDHMDSKTIASQTVGVLKQVAGNDNVKASIVEWDGAALIVAAVDRHHGASAALCENACAALAALTLRSPANSKRVVESGGPQAVLQCMKAQARAAGVQKQACMAIRNMVARSREYCDLLLTLGAEELIRRAAEGHKECADEGKAALRDLGCKVDLRELWKGERGSLAR